MVGDLCLSIYHMHLHNCIISISTLPLYMWYVYIYIYYIYIHTHVCHYYIYHYVCLVSPSAYLLILVVWGHVPVRFNRFLGSHGGRIPSMISMISPLKSIRCYLHETWETGTIFPDENHHQMVRIWLPSKTGPYARWRLHGHGGTPIAVFFFLREKTCKKPT